ncbi:MAG: NADH-quinone oxidoreductase subunit J, partial [Acidimicrobiia bacterium]
IVAAFGVVTSKNPVYSALWLAASMLGVAVLFLAQGAEFLAAVQLIVYAGAVVVLFLFVIMLLGVDRREQLKETLRAQRFGALAVAVPLGATLIALVLLAGGNPVYFGALRHLVAKDNVGQIAEVLFGEYLYPFELTSVLLLGAAIAAIVLAKREAIPK